VTARERLAAALAPELLAALEQLVDERVAGALATLHRGSGSPWLALEEAAAYLRVSERTIERLIAKGRLRSSTIGRRRLVRRDDLDKYAGAGEETAPTGSTPPPRKE
jgi:excisionase family DNA binding protein